MQEISIPSIKLNPKLIPTILKIINTLEHDPKKMRSEIVRYCRDETIRKKLPSESSILRGVVFPSLRKLDLIDGEGVKIHLNGNGLRLFRAYETNFSNYLKLLSERVLLIDKKCRVIETITSISKRKKCSKEILTKELVSKCGVEKRDENKLKDRLKDLLKYFSYLEFITLSSGKIELNKAQIDSTVLGIKTPTTKKFFATLLKNYNKLSLLEKGVKYVSIPELRNKVASDLGIHGEVFNELLIKLKTKFGGYRLVYSSPMVRAEKGIVFNGKYYYFISIYKEHR